MKEMLMIAFSGLVEALDRDTDTAEIQMSIVRGDGKRFRAVLNANKDGCSISLVREMEREPF